MRTADVGARDTELELHRSKYDAVRAARYSAHHERSFRARLTTWRERSLLARALARLAPLDSILDIPCGSGRLFPVLIDAVATTAQPTIIAADNSAAMLAIAARSAAAGSGRIRLLETSAFAIDLPDRAVDCVVCARFFHHLARPEDRARALAEIARVARRGAVVSLWVDGNWQARRRARREATAGFGARGVVSRTTIEQELSSAGFAVIARYDLLRGVSMWRQYVLRKRAAGGTS